MSAITPWRAKLQVHRTLFILGFLLLLLGSHSRAELSATVDRTEISQNESLQLLVTTRLDIGSTFDLFNLNTLSIPQPDIAGLEKDFEILDRQQNYQVKIENNQNNSVISWTYTLMPKRRGDIVIPAISYEGKSSSPITIRVREVDSNTAEGQKPVFLETEVDLTEVYVQQQILFKVRLFYALDLVGGELNHPDHQNALFTQLGKQKEFSRYVGSQRFNVIERTYAIFPKTAGELVIPELVFSGSFMQGRFGKRIYRKETTQPIRITVNPPPAEFTGDLWLPAQSLSIRDSWSAPAREINVGDSLTRTIDIQALGLEGVQLPPLSAPDLQGIRLYPEPAKTENQQHAAGLTGTRQEVQALVAIHPGTYRLPEIRIPWWDVVNNRAREAILPGRVISVLGNGQMQNNAATPMPGPAADLTSQLQLSEQMGLGQASEPRTADPNLPVWQGLTALFCLLWLLTGYAWWRRPKLRALPVEQPSGSLPIMDFASLKASAMRNPSAFSYEVGRWLRQQRQSHQLSDQSLIAIETAIRPELIRLQRSRYGLASDQVDMQDSIQKILTAIEENLRNETPDAKQLQALYP